MTSNLFSLVIGFLIAIGTVQYGYAQATKPSKEYQHRFAVHVPFGFDKGSMKVDFGLNYEWYNRKRLSIQLGAVRHSKRPYQNPGPDMIGTTIDTQRVLVQEQTYLWFIPLSNEDHTPSGREVEKYLYFKQGYQFNCNLRLYGKPGKKEVPGSGLFAEVGAGVIFGEFQSFSITTSRFSVGPPEKEYNPIFQSNNTYQNYHIRRSVTEEKLSIKLNGRFHLGYLFVFPNRISVEMYIGMVKGMNPTADVHFNYKNNASMGIGIGYVF